MNWTWTAILATLLFNVNPSFALSNSANLAASETEDEILNIEGDEVVDIDNLEVLPQGPSTLDFATYLRWLEANPHMDAETEAGAFQSLEGMPDYDPTAVAAEEGVDLNAIEAEANSPQAQLYTPVCGARANVNLTSQSMTLSGYGKWDISSGMRGRATPTGCYGIVARIKHAYSAAYGNAPMPNAVFFIKLYSKKKKRWRYTHALHAGKLPKRKARGYGLSHGCVRQAYANSLKTWAASGRCTGGMRVCVSY